MLRTKTHSLLKLVGHQGQKRFFLRIDTTEAGYEGIPTNPQTIENTRPTMDSSPKMTFDTPPHVFDTAPAKN
jgi:hypothetical protein